MIPKNPSTNRYWYGPYEGYETRSQNRLREDLGIDEAAAETILHLRNQVVALQSRIRELETELNAQNAPGTLPGSLLRGYLDRTGIPGMILGRDL